MIIAASEGTTGSATLTVGSILPPQVLDAWRVPAPDYGVEFFGYGFKVATYGGRKVIEASQDGTNTYAKIGDALSLRP